MKRGTGTCRPFPESVAAAVPLAESGYRAHPGALCLDSSSDRSGSRSHRERCRKCPIGGKIEMIGELRVPLRQGTPDRPTRDGRAAGASREQLAKYPQRPSGLETTLAGRTHAQSRWCRTQAVEQHGGPLHKRLDAVATLTVFRRS